MLVLMLVRNARRSSGLINFSMADYDARMVDDSFNVVKRSSNHGAATICVNAEEARLKGT